jgi:hypothetical protein
MNPLGIILIGLGIIAIVIGVKGSQHSVIDAIKGDFSKVGSGSSQQQQNPPSIGTPPQTNPGVNPT